MRPIVAVIGTTGVGKSQLAVHLAQCLERWSSAAPVLGKDNSTHSDSASAIRYKRGKVLSADSMQLYKGLDLITNKVTSAEMGGVEHWGLNIVEPGQASSWELGKWCNEADEVVDTLPDTTLPIVCGGTHYYIQHFLFPPPELSISRPSSPPAESSNANVGKSSTPKWSPQGLHPPTPDLDAGYAQLLETFWTDSPTWPDERSDTTETCSNSTWTDSRLLSLHRLLLAVDPREAGRWHWRDGRKVKRALERWWERGKSEDHEEKNPGRTAKFRTLIFWVYETMDSLRPRLDKRVDNMVENGLLREVAELREIAKQIYGSPEAADHTEGIFQAIGYKEFAELSIGNADPVADPNFPPMLNRMKLSTHQYAKSQLKWINNQLLPAVNEARSAGGEIHIYAVPGGQSNEEFTQKTLFDFLMKGSMPNPDTAGHMDSKSLLAQLSAGKEKALNTLSRQSMNIRRTCEVCSTLFSPYSVMAKDWELHVKSKGHKRHLIAADGGREALIEKQKQAGQQRAEERARLRAVQPERQSVLHES